MSYFFSNLLVQIAAFLIAGIVLLIIFSVINRFVASLAEENKRAFYLHWRRFQIIFWLLYSLFFYSVLFRYDFAITSIATLVVLGLGWQFWKDVFAGVLIKLESRINAGDFISTEFSKGALQTVNISNSELVNDAGELVIIPNHRLRNAVLTHHQSVSDASIYSVEVKSESGQTIGEIYEFAYNCPYISANKELTIEKQNENVFNIRGTIIDFSFAEQADEYFKRLSRKESGVEH